MRTILIFGIYCIFSMLVLPIPEALLMSFVAGLTILGIVKLTRSNGLVDSFGWFRKYKGNGVFIAALTAMSAVMLFVNSAGSFAQVCVQLILAFLWFWAFAAIGTFFNERRAKGRE